MQIRFIVTNFDPFNSFKTIETNYDNTGRIDIKINKKYSKVEITKIQNKMNEITLKLNINCFSTF